MNYLRKASVIITLLVAISTLSGCSFFTPYKAPITQGTVIDKASLDSLQDGLTPQQVVDLLGPPYGQDPFDPNHWVYVFYTADETFHPDATDHLWVTFDQAGYLTDWQVVKDQPVALDRSFNDGLGLFD